MDKYAWIIFAENVPECPIYCYKETELNDLADRIYGYELPTLQLRNVVFLLKDMDLGVVRTLNGHRLVKISESSA